MKWTLTKAPSNKSNQHHDNTTNPSSLPSTSLPTPLSPSSKEQTSEATNQTTSLPSPSSHAPVKANSIISFNVDTNYQDKVLSRAAKASGKYKSCYNIEYLSQDNFLGQQTWINVENQKVWKLTRYYWQTQDLDNLDNIDITFIGNKPEATKTDKVLLTNSQTFNIAKEKELKSWEDNNIHDVVPYNHQKCISVRWVCSLKGNQNNTIKAKTRLVARGFEEENLHKVPKDSPTCGKDSLKGYAGNNCHK